MVAPRALTPFQTWQFQYFGCTNCTEAAVTADPDGDGRNSTAEFLTGTNPTNNASAFRIISTVLQDNDVVVTWQTAGGKTNALQATPGTNGGYSTNFTDLFIVTNTVGTVTNYLDGGAVTNFPARYYRVRLVP